MLTKFRGEPMCRFKIAKLNFRWFGLNCLFMPSSGVLWHVTPLCAEQYQRYPNVTSLSEWDIDRTVSYHWPTVHYVACGTMEKWSTHVYRIWGSGYLLLFYFNRPHQIWWGRKVIIIDWNCRQLKSVVAILLIHSGQNPGFLRQPIESRVE